MERAVKTLEELDVSTRKRVLDFLNARFGWLEVKFQDTNPGEIDGVRIKLSNADVEQIG